MVPLNDFIAKEEMEVKVNGIMKFKKSIHNIKVDRYFFIGRNF